MHYTNICNKKSIKLWVEYLIIQAKLTEKSEIVSGTNTINFMICIIRPSQKMKEENMEKVRRCRRKTLVYISLSGKKWNKILRLQNVSTIL